LAWLQSLLNSHTTPGDADVLTITSIHRAKGKEYPLVLMYGLEDGHFPRHGASLEEERRLFYVGVTRAQEELALLCPRDDYLRQHAEQSGDYGPDLARLRASRFVYEMQPVRAVEHSRSHFSSTPT
jgi:superfamily I DNA/RNA helicase